MKITKELKHARFTWNEESKTFCVESPKGNRIELDKIYSFALMRFIIRIAQRNFLKNPLPKDGQDVIIEESEEDFEDPRQQKFDF